MRLHSSERSHSLSKLLPSVSERKHVSADVLLIAFFRDLENMNPREGAQEEVPREKASTVSACAAFSG